MTKFTQVVTVEIPGAPRHYAYKWEGEEALVIGDTVVIPPNWVNNDYSRATVVRYGGSDEYRGPLAEIVEKVKADAQGNGGGEVQGL